MTEIKAKKVIFKNRDGEYLLPMTEEKTGLVLFDTILKDHILTYEETKGLALQGTYVYKEAIAGSRYGYADFYNKCLEEYNDSSNIKQWIKSNITQVGALTDNNGVLSGFTGSVYAKVDKPVDFNSADSWEINIKLKTGSNYTAFNDFFGVTNTSIALGISNERKFSLALGVGEGGWTIGSPVGTHSVQDNTNYYIRVKFTGNAYTFEYSLNGQDYSTDITIESTVRVASGQPTLGIFTAGSSNFTGSIDLTESYININGSRFWTGAKTIVKNQNGHTFYDISQKDYVDEIFNSTGMAWMYGIDTENERIFLPRNNWFEQASIDGVGESVEAGLPNITGRAGSLTNMNAVSDLGALYTEYRSTEDQTMQSVKNQAQRTLYLDASRSSAIYGNSDTVQPNAVKKLLYICVGNTIAQSAVTDVIDITTTENDTIPLGYSTYQNGAQPSVAWLKSEGQWNDGNVYTTFYNEFVNKLGQKFASGKVVNHTEEYTDYDLVINQDDMTFRLPLYNGDGNMLDYANFTELPITKAQAMTYTAPSNGAIVVDFTAYHSTASQKSYIKINGVTLFNGNSNGNSNFLNTKNGEYLVSKGDAVEYKHVYETANAGIYSAESIKFIPLKGNGDLYFKVANAVQNLELLNAGEVLEAVANVVPNNSELITSFGCPDWDGKISCGFPSAPLSSTTTTFTCPSAGYIQCYFRKTSAGNDFYLDVNGVRQFASIGVVDHTNNQWFFAVSKGDVIRVYTNSTSNTYTNAGTYFIPMKGAN